jgi:hypothetical protein
MYATTVHDLSQGRLADPRRQAQREALFASGLQPSDAPTADMITQAITRTLQRFGTGGCAGRMAQEFGDHPDAAAERMRWVRRLTVQASGFGARPDGPGISQGRAAA